MKAYTKRLKIFNQLTFLLLLSIFSLGYSEITNCTAIEEDTSCTGQCKWDKGSNKCLFQPCYLIEEDFCEGRCEWKSDTCYTRCDLVKDMNTCLDLNKIGECSPNFQNELEFTCITFDCYDQKTTEKCGLSPEGCYLDLGLCRSKDCSEIPKICESRKLDYNCEDLEPTDSECEGIIVDGQLCRLKENGNGEKECTEVTCEDIEVKDGKGDICYKDYANLRCEYTSGKTCSKFNSFSSSTKCSEIKHQADCTISTLGCYWEEPEDSATEATSICRDRTCADNKYEEICNSERNNYKCLWKKNTDDPTKGVCEKKILSCSELDGEGNKEKCNSLTDVEGGCLFDENEKKCLKKECKNTCGKCSEKTECEESSAKCFFDEEDENKCKEQICENKCNYCSDQECQAEENEIRCFFNSTATEGSKCRENKCDEDCGDCVNQNLCKNSKAKCVFEGEKCIPAKNASSCEILGDYCSEQPEKCGIDEEDENKCKDLSEIIRCENLTNETCTTNTKPKCFIDTDGQCKKKKCSLRCDFCSQEECEDDENKERCFYEIITEEKEGETTKSNQCRDRKCDENCDECLNSEKCQASPALCVFQNDKCISAKNASNCAGLEENECSEKLECLFEEGQCKDKPAPDDCESRSENNCEVEGENKCILLKNEEQTGEETQKNQTNSERQTQEASQENQTSSEGQAETKASKCVKLEDADCKLMNKTQCETQKQRCIFENTSEKCIKIEDAPCEKLGTAELCNTQSSRCSFIDGSCKTTEIKCSDLGKDKCQNYPSQCILFKKEGDDNESCIELKEADCKIMSKDQCGLQAERCTFVETPGKCIKTNEACENLEGEELCEYHRPRCFYVNETCKDEKSIECSELNEDQCKNVTSKCFPLKKEETKETEQETSTSTSSFSCLERNKINCSELSQSQCSEISDYCRASKDDPSKCEELQCPDYNETQCNEHNEKCQYYPSISKCFSSGDLDDYCNDKETHKDQESCEMDSLCFWSEEFSECHSKELGSGVTCENSGENKGCDKCFGFYPEKCQKCKKGLEPSWNQEKGFTCSCKSGSNNCKVCEAGDLNTLSCEECEENYETNEVDGIKICKVQNNKLCLFGEQKVEYCVKCNTTEGYGNYCIDCDTKLATLNKDMHKCIKKEKNCNGQYDQDGNCVDQCDPGYNKADSSTISGLTSKICSKDCFIGKIQYFIENGACVEACSEGKALEIDSEGIKGKECIDCFKFISNDVCVNECPKGLVEYGKECITLTELKNKQEENPEVKIEVNVECKNNGTFNNVSCDCEKDYIGTFCEYNKNDNNITEVIKDEVSNTFDFNASKIMTNYTETTNSTSVTKAIEDLPYKEKEKIANITDEVNAKAENLINVISELDENNLIDEETTKDITESCALIIASNVNLLKNNEKKKNKKLFTGLQLQSDLLFSTFLQSRIRSLIFPNLFPTFAGNRNRRLEELDEATKQLIKDTYLNMKYVFIMKADEKEGADPGIPRQNMKDLNNTNFEGLFSFVSVPKDNETDYEVISRKKEIEPIQIKFNYSTANPDDYDYLLYEKVDKSIVDIFNNTEVSKERVEARKLNPSRIGKLPTTFKIPMNEKFDPENDDFLNEKGRALIVPQEVLDRRKEYEKYDIDIFNASDPAFIDRCHNIKLKKFEDELDYDLPQKYLVKKVFAGYINQGFYCGNGSFINVTETDGKKYYICQTNEGSTPAQGVYILKESPLEITIRSPITRCRKELTDWSDNIGLWFYMSVFILFIIIFGVIIFLRCSGKFGYESAIENDAPNNEFWDQGNQRGTNKGDVINISDIDFETRKFSSYFCKNVFLLHPLFNFIRNSFFYPPIINTMILFTNICTLFGFNAVYFTYDMLKDRIEDKHRDNFGYPMKTEFERIMASIAFSCAFTLVLKCINLTSYGTKSQFAGFIGDVDVYEAYDSYWKSMLPRRILLFIVALAMDVWMWYYAIMFCGNYHHAQYGWFYSGIWALIWDWFVFSFVFILLVTAMEKGGTNHCCLYYIKSLFFF